MKQKSFRILSLMLCLFVGSSVTMAFDAPCCHSGMLGTMKNVNLTTSRSSTFTPLTLADLRSNRDPYRSDHGMAVRNINGAQGVLTALNMNLSAKGTSVAEISRETDRKGNTHVRMQQYYKGILVVGADTRVTVSDNNIAFSAGGFLARNLSLSTSPSLSEAAAEKAAIVALPAEIVQRINDISLVIYNGKLAYRVYVEALSGHPATWECLVDAHNGTLLMGMNTIQFLHREGPGPGDHVKIDGYLLDGESGAAASVEGFKESSTGKYWLYNKNASWGVKNYKNQSNPNVGGGDWETYTANQWTQSLDDRVAISMAENIENCQKYFKDVLKINSFDNNGAFVQCNVRITDRDNKPNYVNAYWNGRNLNFGDGDNVKATPLTTLDVAAHEIGHAITTHTSNLVYRSEPGALNEGYSDIIGCLVEFYIQDQDVDGDPTPGKSDWLLGEDCWKERIALRSMRNPMEFTSSTTGKPVQPSYYKGTSWKSTANPNPDNDNGGVHTNSGVINHAFYLLAVGGEGTNDGNPYENIEGIGIEKSGEIAMYANMKLHNSQDQYAQARKHWLDAAATLGHNIVSVAKTFDAVGVKGNESILSADMDVVFDTTETGKKSTKKITLTAYGSNGSITVSGITSSDPAFTVKGTFPLTINGGSTAEVDVEFAPTDVKDYSAKLTITSNADLGKKVDVNVSGYAKAGVAINTALTSVKKLGIQSLTRNKLQLSIAKDGVYTVSVLSSNGQVIRSMKNIHLTEGYRSFDLNNLSKGMYLIRISNKHGVLKTLKGRVL